MGYVISSSTTRSYAADSIFSRASAQHSRARAMSLLMSFESHVKPSPSGIISMPMRLAARVSP